MRWFILPREVGIRPVGVRLKIAVIGAGISGLASAHFLQQRHEVTLYEQDGRVGGHTNTVRVPAVSGPVAVDTGWIVYNAPCYPNLTALFAELGIETRPTQMSFGVSLGDGAYEYKGSDKLLSVFAQWSNLFSLSHLRMLAGILRLNRACRARLRGGDLPAGSLGEFLDAEGFGAELRSRYLLPMAGMIWSCSPRQAAQFPAADFMRFFEAHGLFTTMDQPQWRSVIGGSDAYVRKILATFKGRLRLDARVRSLRRDSGGVIVASDAGEERYDRVICATHSDQALALLTDADALEQRVLGGIPYTESRCVLHTDESFLPRRRAAWASWNYQHRDDEIHDERICGSYWMNLLQGIEGPVNYVVTLNPTREVPRDKVLYETTYHHPFYAAPSVDSHALLPQIQNRSGIAWAGAWCGYGFHEDGLKSALAAVQSIDPACLKNWGQTTISSAAVGNGGLSPISAGDLYPSRVMHRRLVAPLYRFVYKLFHLLLDVDRVDELHRKLKLFSHNRFNLVSFHDADHGGGDRGGLRAWAERLVASEGILLQGGRIRLLCLPRILGFTFNPISIWYCEHRDGGLRAVIAEVRNTFGERHSYVLASAGRPMAYEGTYEKDKCFHVSPFMDLVGRYQFRFTEPREKVMVRIHETREGAPLLDATLAGERAALTDGALLRQVLKMPWMTLKVVAGIHWEALKLWLRGAKFHRKPEPPELEFT
ncbi:MAG: FAD-dependent oxidoreductase [Nevskiaceae bacterium]